MSVNNMHPSLTGDHLRSALSGFWNEALEIAPTATGYALAMPISDPDGWQIVVHIGQIAPAACQISDKGRTLGWLAGRGQNIHSSGFRDHLQEHLQIGGIECDGSELSKVISPAEVGLELHLFAERLAAIAHLSVLHEAAEFAPNTSQRLVEKIFAERRLNVSRNQALAGKADPKIEVNYYIAPYHIKAETRTVAIQIISRQKQLKGYMQQWGWRWYDLLSAHKNLLPAMVYDPDTVPMDSTSSAIIRSVGARLLPCYEDRQINELLNEVRTD